MASTVAATKNSDSSSDMDSDSDFEMEPLVSDDEDSDADDELDVVIEPFVPTFDEKHVETEPVFIPQTMRQRRQSKSDPAAQKAFLAQMAQRRESIGGLKPNRSNPALTLDIRRNKSNPHLIQEEEEDDHINEIDKRCPRAMWKKAMKLLRKRRDPWQEFHIHQFETHACVRHRYNALKRIWVRDEVFVKMETLPWNHGAMRECFRLKKLQKRHGNWLRAHNYVAKKYIQDVDRSIYFEDVVLQMDAKLWGEEFNRHRPPKKVDIFQMAVIEFKDMPESPLYHLEHFIEGEYIKYNSNSGFVEEHMRLTPQAFSHFTFERSGHQLIVIDIQGVGDLYTDPQIHTYDSVGYGDGNLGTRGMALFFHSHVCNKICEILKLAPFDLADSEKEKKAMYQNMFDAATKIRGFEEMCISPSPKERIDLSKFLHKRTISTSSRGSGNDDSGGDADSHMSDHERDFSEEDDDFDEPPIMFRPRRNLISESETDTLNKDDERNAFTLAMQKRHRSSCFAAEISKLQLRKLSDTFTKRGPEVEDEESILGRIHLDLAKYHEAGRFTMNESDIDHGATLFHLEHSASLGIMEAVLTMGRLHLGMPRDLLCEFDLIDYKKGMQYMEEACGDGNREAAVLVAHAYEKGQFDLKRDWQQAIYFYEKAIDMTTESCISSMEDPKYMLLASVAAMYAEGGHGIEPEYQKAYDLYQEAAEEAQAAMKGRLAMKYYTMAEEAAAYLED